MVSRGPFDDEPELACTCGGYHFTHAYQHELDCELYDDPYFRTGDAIWDPEQGDIVYLVDFDDEDEEQLDPTTGERMAGTSNSLMDKVLKEADPVFDTDDIIKVVLQELTGPDMPISDEHYEKCVAYIGPDILDIFESLSNMRSIELVDVDAIENWGASLHLLTDKDIPPLYDCICSSKNHVWCGGCGVIRCNNGTGPWVPTYARRKHEVMLFLTGGMYQCVCDKPAVLACAKCGVQRWNKEAAWTFYDPDLYNKRAFPDKTNGGIYPISSSSSFGGTTSYGGSHTAWVPKCRHYGEIVKLPDGTPIMCSSEHRRKDDDPKPDFGCYMYSGWEPDWLAYWLNWTDYGLPKMSMATVWKIVDDLLARARAGQIVEIGCMGGHGRTGTLLAALALKAGAADATAAATFVWDNYCKEAIEGDTQEWYIECLDADLKGVEAPPKPVKPCTKYAHETLFKKGERCTLAVCKDEQKHHDDWVADEAKKKVTSLPFAPAPASSKKTSNGGGSSTAGSTTTSATSGADDKVADIIYAPVTWMTPIPEKEGIDSGVSQGWCSMRRHFVIWWRRELCTCSYWNADIQKFAERGEKQYPLLVKGDDKERPAARTEVMKLIDEGKTLVEIAEELKLRAQGTACTKPEWHETEGPCVFGHNCAAVVEIRRKTEERIAKRQLEDLLDEFDGEMIETWEAPDLAPIGKVIDLTTGEVIEISDDTVSSEESQPTVG